MKQMMIYNTLSRKKEPFVPVHEGKCGIYACGPTPMLRAIKAYAEKNSITAWLSLEERMACGVGACLGCVVRTERTDEHSNVRNRRVCADGPVFEATEVII